MPHVELRGAEVDGLTLHYVTDGRGPAAVLVHGLGGFAQSWRHNVPALPRVAAEIGFLVREGYAARTSPEAKGAYLATLRDVRRDVLDHASDYRRALATLEVPVLLIHGQQDGVVAADHSREAAEVLPRASVRWIDGCGHFPQIEHAEIVNSWLTEFLVGRPAPR